MASLFDISADEIEAWSATKVAEALLPKLVRRLVAASIRSGLVRFRADAGVRLPGFDGIVNAVEPTFFCPPGLSVWELSVNHSPGTKANKDFEARVATPVAGVSYPDATYVAVTGRRFSGRHEWQAEKRSRGVFADVLAYDADDLESALEQAPAVAIWFAEIIGRPIRDLADPESFLARWARETRPPLPPALLTAGRDDEARAVRAWLERADGAPLHVQAETRVEAAAFLAAVLTLEADPDQLSRIAVVESAEAWRSTIRRTRREPLLLIPTFDPVPLGEASENVRVAIPLGSDVRAQGAINLPTLMQKDVCDALVASGFERAHADNVARSSRGKIATLKHLCGVPRALPWASGDPDSVLLALLLIGSWQPATKTDREAIEALGVSADEADARCTSLSKIPDPPIERHGAAWRWTSPTFAWDALAPRLGELLLTKFRDMAIDVLGRPATVGLFGVTVSHSAALRGGIASSLVHLALNDDALRATLGTSRGSALAETVLRCVLKMEWQAWVSLGDLLSTLAEAAPARFLDALEESIDAGEAGAARLTAEERTSWYPHVRVLWALETLGWAPEFVTRVASALARLAERDPGGHVVNRPARSLGALLHWTVPQTAASVGERVLTLKMLFRRYPGVARGIALGHLDGLRAGMMTNAPRPKFRSWELPPPGTQAPGADAYVQISETVDLLLADAGEDGDRWAALIKPIVWLPSALQERAVEALESRASRMMRRTPVLSALRERLHWLHIATRSPDLIPRFTKVLELLAPADEVERGAWLFAPGATLPEKVGDWQDEERRRDELRSEVMKRIWSREDRWGLLRRLAQEAPAPWIVAWTISRLPFARECEHTMRGEEGTAWNTVLPTLIALRVRQAGADIENELRGLVEGGRMALAREVALGVEANRTLWRTLAVVSAELAKSYWLTAPTWAFQEREDVEFAVGSLLAVGRPGVAAQIASHAADRIRPQTAFLVLDALRAAGALEAEAFIGGGASTYHVERLFEVVDRDPEIPTGRTAALEVAFMSLLKETRRGVPHLSRALAANHEEFLGLVRIVYRAEGEPKPEGDAATERQSRAEGASRVLWDWEGVPGAHLPEAEREAFLLEWCRNVLRALSSEGRAIPGICEVGRVLARAPDGPDGIWPCVPARELIDGGEYPLLARQLPSDKYNLRGVTTRALDDGGRQERTIAAGLRRDAERLRVEFPRTAAMLVAMADDYGTEAEDEDVRSRVMLDEDRTIIR